MEKHPLSENKSYLKAPTAEGIHFIGTYWCDSMSIQDLEKFRNRLMARAILGQMEVTQRGKKHFQFYFLLKKKKRLSFYINRFPHCHFEKCQNYKAARQYVTKIKSAIADPLLLPQGFRFHDSLVSSSNNQHSREETKAEFTQEQKQAKRQERRKEKYREIYEEIDEKGVDKFLQDNPMHPGQALMFRKQETNRREYENKKKQQERIDKLELWKNPQGKRIELTLSPKQQTKKRHFVIIAPSNYGKSHFFRNLENSYKMNYEKFQDNYCGQQICYFDEWKASKCPSWTDLEMYLDGRPIFNVKHQKDRRDFLPINLFILTNQKDPFSVYRSEIDDMDVIKNRFTFIDLEEYGYKKIKEEKQEEAIIRFQ